MLEPRPGERVEMVHLETGNRVTVWPIDANEMRATGKWAPAEGYTPPAPTATTTADLTPDPPALPGQPKAGRQPKPGRGEGLG